MTCCKQCGQSLPPELRLGLRLNPGEQRIFDIVRRAGVYGILSDRLFDLLYQHDPEGGPLTGKRCMQVRICNLNQKIRQRGWTISSEHTGSYSGTYTLAPVK